MVAFEIRLATFRGSKAFATRDPVFVEFKKLPFSESKQCCNASFKNMLRRGELSSTTGALDRMARKLEESPPLGGTSSHKSDKGTLTKDDAANKGNVIKLTHRTPVTNAAQCRQWPTPPGCRIGAFITMSAPLQDPSNIPSIANAIMIHPGSQTAMFNPNLRFAESLKELYHECALLFANRMDS